MSQGMSKRSDFTERLERRARRAIFWHALLRWESAILISLTLVTAAFLALAAWAGMLPSIWAVVVLGAGLLTEAIIFVSSLTDEEDNARVVATMLREEGKVEKIQSAELRARVGKALEYRQMIAKAILRTREGVLRDRLARATESMDDWIDAIHRLAARLDAYELNQVVKRDLHTVPMAIKDFREQLTAEDDPAVQRTLRNTIADKERQLDYLNRLQNTMERARYQLESTIAALGAVYAQLQAIDVRGSEGGRADRLREEINEQVAQLQELSEAVDEVYEVG